MEFFSPAEMRLVQERAATSAADALLLAVGGTVPENKVWTIVSVGYRPSVAETQVVSFYKITRANSVMSLLNPVSMNLNPATATPVEQGMSLILFPGEQFGCRRVAATGGSTMFCIIQFIEEDLPLYDYVEPQEALRQKLTGTVIRKLVSRGARGGGGGGSSGGSRGGRIGPPAR